MAYTTSVNIIPKTSNNYCLGESSCYYAQVHASCVLAPVCVCSPTIYGSTCVCGTYVVSSGYMCACIMCICCGLSVTMCNICACCGNIEAHDSMGTYGCIYARNIIHSCCGFCICGSMGVSGTYTTVTTCGGIVVSGS